MTKKLIFDTCTKQNCNRCDIGYILKKYVKPLMQTLTNDIREYYMRLLTTKCLNSAVFIAVFMLGKRKGIEIANYCDTEKTRQRHRDQLETNYSIITSYKTDILDKNCKYRYLYYILLTDGKFPSAIPNGKEGFFPGHVFILEKIPGKIEPYFYFYQSYINAYDLNGHVKHNNNSLKISYNKAADILDNLKYILESPTWDQNCVDKWKSFTFADTTSIKDTLSKNQFFLCIKKARVTDCLKHIEKYTKDKIMEMNKSPLYNKEIYGDSSLYDKNQKPLTVSQMYKKLNKLHLEITEQKNKYVSQKI